MKTQLFDVIEDPGQLSDQANEHIEVVERLRRRAVQFLQSMKAPPEQLERLGLASFREVGRSQA